jgi:hypothetical protein
MTGARVGGGPRREAAYLLAMFVHLLGSSFLFLFLLLLVGQCVGTSTGVGVEIVNWYLRNEIFQQIYITTPTTTT